MDMEMYYRNIFYGFFLFLMFTSIGCKIHREKIEKKIDNWNGASVEMQDHYTSIRDSFKHYLYADTAKGRIYVDSLVVLGKKIGLVKQLESLTNKASYFYVIGKIDTAKAYYLSVINNDFTKLNPKYGFFARLSLSQLYMNAGEHDKARILLDEIENADYIVPDKEFSTFLYRSILASHEKDKEAEMRYLIKADSVGTEDLKQRFNLFYNLGGTLFNTHDYKNAVQYYQKAILLIDSLNAKAYFSVIYNVMAAGYEKLDSLAKMKFFIEKAIEKSEYAPKEKGVSYYYLGTYYLRQKDFTAAQKANNMALDEFRKYDYRFYLLHALNQAIFIKNKLGDESSSKELIDEAYENCSAFFSLQDSLIFEEYKIRDQFRYELPSKDYQFLVDFLNTKTVFEENRTNDKVAELIKKYSSEKIKIQNQLQKEQLAAAEAKSNQQKMLLWGLGIVAILAFLFTVFSMRQYKEKQKLNRQLLENNKRITALNHDIVHRSKNNLTLLASILQMQARRANSPAAEQVLKENYNRIMTIANLDKQLLEGGNNLKVNLQDFLIKITNSAQVLFENRDKPININSDVDKDIIISSSSALSIGIIINELITNSVKHAFRNNDKPLITIILSKDTDSILLHYEDNGIGFSEDFDLVSANSMGLKLIHIMSQQLYGNPYWQKEQGMQFNLKIPINNIA